MSQATTIRLCVLTVLLASSSPWSGATGEETSPPATDTQLRLAVPRALPVLGQEQVLTAHIAYHGQTAREVAVRFSFRSSRQSGEMGTEQSVKLLPGTQEIAVRQAWRPGQTGEYTLTAQLRSAGQGQTPISCDAKQIVTVVGRRLHFHYWHADPSLKYITECMVNDRKQLDDWADRGVIAQRWCGGLWAYRHAKKQTPAALGEYWVAPYRAGWPGTVIDEFGAGGETDEVLGRGLLEARKLEPKVYLAPYTVSLGGQDKLRGFREAADRVLIEAYEPDGTYGYRGILNRVRPAKEHGLADKALVALGLGQALGHDACAITTPQELRRQLHFTRYQFPEMPGVAFFSSMAPLVGALNELLGQFYVQPVLRVEALQGGEVRVENIGGGRSPATQVKIVAGDGQARTISLNVPSLEAGQRHTATLPARDLQPVTQYQPGCFVLGPPPAWGKEAAEFRPKAADPWPPAGQLAASVKESFDARPSLQIEYDRSGKEGYQGNVSAASYAIPSTQRRGCELRFDLDPIKTWFYGGIRVGLGEKDGKSRLDLALYRGDHQPGVYVQVSIKNHSGLPVRERMAWIIEPGKHYRLRARYEPRGVVRAAILDQGGQTLWDTGEIPAYGEATFDQVCFGVRSGKGSKLDWDADRKAMLLRGTTGPQYVQSAYVDNVEVDCFRSP